MATPITITPGYGQKKRASGCNYWVFEQNTIKVLKTGLSVAVKSSR